MYIFATSLKKQHAFRVSGVQLTTHAWSGRLKTYHTHTHTHNLQVEKLRI